MESAWEDRSFSDEIDERVYSSRLLGKDPNLVLHGGGNTSVKRKEKDHTGREISVLRVKGSGSDLATIEPKDFTGLRMDDLLHAENIESMSDEQMVDYLKKSMVDPSEPSPSVESFLHAFIPYKFVDHSHADAILSITNTDLAPDMISAILDNVIVVPYVPPGFKLAKEILKHISSMRLGIEGIVLSKHGLFTFGNTAKESYERHVTIVDQAERYIASRVPERLFKVKYGELSLEDARKYLPVIRGSVSRSRKKILKIDTFGMAKEIAMSEQAENFTKMGPATSDMLIRTKHDYLYIDDLEKSAELIEKYAADYRKDYEKYVKGFPMHDPYPSVIVVRGFGIITCGVTSKEATIIHDQIIHSFIVNARTENIGKHEFISRQEAYHMEYWPLQEAKLKKSVPKQLHGTVSVVTGAASGIGLAAFKKLAENGSAVIACDVDPSISKVTIEIEREFRTGCMPYIVDLSHEGEIKKMFSSIVERYGGVDIIFNNAGILKSAPIETLDLKDLDMHYRINARGSFIVSQEAFRIMKTQGIGGNMVFNITKNLLHPGPEMTSYGASKAFAAQVCHYVAKEGGKYGIRANIINPDKIFKGSKIWEGGVLESRAKAKGQTIEEYKTQNLLGVEVLPEHVVGVLMALIDDSTFGATTDAMIPVDGGIK